MCVSDWYSMNCSSWVVGERTCRKTRFSDLYVNTVCRQNMSARRGKLAFPHPIQRVEMTFFDFLFHLLPFFFF